MEQAALFALDDSSGAASAEFCAAPIGRTRTRRPRPVSRRRRVSAAVLVAELRHAIERQHAEVLAELARLGRARRDREELVPLMRAVAALRRDLGLSDLHEPPRATRRRPLGAE